MVRVTPSAAASAMVIQSKALFADAKRKSVKSLNGIAVDLVVSSHEVEGDTIIEGDIPDTALVIAKHGKLTVNGYVTGNIVGEGDIAVKGNITGGYVISTRGNIQAAQVLGGSHVIAIMGSVAIESAESAACVFAWKDLFIDKDVFGGRYLGSKINVGGKVCGAELHSTGAMHVGVLEPPPHGHTLVCLRNEISCEEFGRPMGQDERKLRRSIGKHQYARSMTARLVRYAEHDVQDSHLTFLYMLLSGKLDPQKMSAMRGLQAQSNFLSEIMAVCDQLIQFFSDAWRQPDAAAEEYDALAEQCMNTLAALYEDTVLMANAFRLQHKPYIVGACDDLSKTAHGLKRQPITKVTALSLITKFRERRARCEELRQELSAHLNEAIVAMGLDPALAQSVESQPQKAELMLETVKAKIERDVNNPRYGRMKSPLARLLQNTVDRSRKNILHWQASLAENDAQLKEIHERLGATATTMFATEETYLQCQRCEAGVTLVGAPRNGQAPLDTAASQITLADAVTNPTRYQLHNLEIQRRAATL